MCLSEERAREDAVEDGVCESSATPERVFITKSKKAATARMASLLHKVLIETSLVYVELETLPPRQLATAGGERLRKSQNPLRPISLRAFDSTQMSSWQRRPTA